MCVSFCVWLLQFIMKEWCKKEYNWFCCQYAAKVFRHNNVFSKIVFFKIKNIAININAPKKVIWKEI